MNIEMRLSAAREHLRSGKNPFESIVATNATTEIDAFTTVLELVAGPLATLMEIVNLYRTSNIPSRIFPIFGDPGSGKTHLSHVLFSELVREGREAGNFSLLMRVDRQTRDADPATYLVWQMVSSLLDKNGEGGQILKVLAKRVTNRLLAEALRQLPVHRRIELIPAHGFLESIKLRFGRRSAVQKRLDGIMSIINFDNNEVSQGREIVAELEKQGFPIDNALMLIRDHLGKTESKDVIGWYRCGIYEHLTQVVLAGNPTGLEEFLSGDHKKIPTYVREAGNQGSFLLRALLELFQKFHIPVVVCFDQLENFIYSPDPKLELELRKAFSQMLASFVDRLPHVCVLVFAERGFWNMMIQNTDPYIVGRISQPISLPGREATDAIRLAPKLDTSFFPSIIRKRVASGFPHLDLTGLPDIFPFSEVDLERAGKEATLRISLRSLRQSYDRILYGQPLESPIGPNPSPAPPTPSSTQPITTPQEAQNTAIQRIADLWEAQLAATKKELGSRLPVSTTLIPRVQSAINAWLKYHSTALAPSALQGKKIDLLNHTSKAQYGIINVIRRADPLLPGIGVAAWFGTGAAKPADLRARLGFFESNPCPMDTLVLLRHDGDKAVSGGLTGEMYNSARAQHRDVRIQVYEAKDLHGLLSFEAWYVAAKQELEGNADEIKIGLSKFAQTISERWLMWVTSWMVPSHEGLLQ